MVAASEEVANLWQRRIGELAAKVHGNLTREGDAARALLRVQVLDPDLEVGSDDFLDDLERHFFLAVVREDILERFGDDLGRQGFLMSEA